MVRLVSEDQPPALGIAAELYEYFAVFRRTTDGQPPLPASVIERWDRITRRGFNASYGLDAAKAQHVRVAERDIWLVPGTAGVAMLVPVAGKLAEEPAYGTISTDLTNVMAGRTVMWLMGPGQTQTIIGLVPDTNKTICLENGSGEVIEAPVVDNIYTATTPTPFRVWQVHDASGELHPVASAPEDDG